MAENDKSPLVLQLGDAMMESAVQQLHLLHELKRSLPTPAALLPQEGGLKVPGLDPQSFLTDLARLSVRTQRDLLELSSKHFDAILDQVKSLAGAAAPAPSLPPRLVLELVASGATPDEAAPSVTSTAFCIENPFNRNLDVSFTDVSFFAVGADNAATSAPPFLGGVEFLRDGDERPIAPGQLISLAPGGRANLQVRVPVGHAAFARGSQYYGEASVLARGRVSAIVALRLQVQ